MKIALINESFPTYNLATERIQVKLQAEGHEIYFSPRVDIWSRRCDKAYLSAIFTWNLPQLCVDIQLLQESGVELEVGGPAATAMPEYIIRETGVVPHIGLNDRFEYVAGQFKMVFTSRGCIRKCPWCVVRKVEPVWVEYDDFPIPIGSNPFIGDNCLLATSWEHQQLVVKKMKDVRRLDINSGFDCRLFTEEHYQLYSGLHLEAWRLAFDSMGVEKDFERAVGILKKYDIDYRRILVYVLIGFPGTTFQESVYRLEKVRRLGCSPYPQRYMPLDSVDARRFVAPGFDDVQLETLRTYWMNPWAWRTVSWEDYRRGYKPEDAQANKFAI